MDKYVPTSVSPTPHAVVSDHDIGAPRVNYNLTPRLPGLKKGDWIWVRDQDSLDLVEVVAVGHLYAVVQNDEWAPFTVQEVNIVASGEAPAPQPPLANLWQRLLNRFV